MTLRPNPRRTTAAELADRARDGRGEGCSPVACVDDALVVRGTGDPARLAAVAEGRATPQDQASQAVVRDPRPAAGRDGRRRRRRPGGQGHGGRESWSVRRVASLAADLRPGRASLIDAARRRLDLPNVHPVVADGVALPLRPELADRILVDAPCSRARRARRRADARFRIAEADIADLATLQRALLRSAETVLRPGGVLVYSVCTLTAEETTEIDRWAEDALPDLVAEGRPGPPWRPRGRGALLLPHDAGTDGMYVLRLRTRS